MRNLIETAIRTTFYAGSLAVLVCAIAKVLFAVYGVVCHVA